MSEHKTGQSNWSPKQKKDYADRRKKGLRGQVGYAVIVQTVKDDKGKTQMVPVSDKKGSSGQFGLRHYRKLEQKQADKEQRRTTKKQLSSYRREEMSRSQGRGE